jgi:anti-anti-sigma factor
MCDPVDVHVLRLTQEDLTSLAGETLRRLEALRDQGTTRVAADMSQVAWATSLSLGLLLRGTKRLREAGGGLHLFGLPSRWIGLIEICELEDTFEIFDTEQDAIDAFGPPDA